jgi:hypothetical protein
MINEAIFFPGVLEGPFFMKHAMNENLVPDQAHIAGAVSAESQGQ